jgi:nitrilase
MMSHALRAPIRTAAGHFPLTPTDDSTLEQVCERIVDAGLAGARWVIFPEGCLPGYPAWVWELHSGTDPLLDTLRAEVLASAIQIPSDATDRLCSIAQRAQANVVIGVIERIATGNHLTTYSTLLVITAQGRIVGTYRTALARVSQQWSWFPARDEAPGGEDAIVSRIGGI